VNQCPVNHAELMLFRHCREGRGSAPALYAQGDVLTYQEVADVAASCAAWLASSGIEPGDRVILCLPDCAMLAATYFGVVAAGAVAILLDPALPPEDAFYIAQLCDARLAIVQEASLNRLAGLRFLPTIASVVGTGLTWTIPSELSAALAGMSEAAYQVLDNPSGHAYGLLSSGSTGRPKLIVHRHQDIVHGYDGFARPIVGLGAEDRVLSVARMTTGYGLGCSLLMPFLAGASAALVGAGPAADAVTETLQAYGCTLLFAQPRFLADALALPELAGRLRGLRLTVTGGEPLATSLAQRWERLSKVELLDSYGNTEVGFLYISNRPGDVRRNSVGTPIRGIQVEVVDETGTLVQPGQIGKLRVRGPSLSDGYWNDPQRTRQTFQDGWFVTSDLFSLDQDDYYYIHGRSDHLIKLGCGDWVNPNELELVLLEHPRLRECAIVGAPDARGLTVLKALAVVGAAADAGQPLASELGAMIERRWPLQAYKRIDTVEYTSALPKTTAGKLDRAKLHPQSMTEFSYRC
jgi:acyl-coenzyme A synthetase/AMP-(fatty) acid ligase